MSASDYNSALALAPLYNSFKRWQSANKMQRDWEKNVGSKGRRIAYSSRRYDFGNDQRMLHDIESEIKSVKKYMPF